MTAISPYTPRKSEILPPSPSSSSSSRSLSILSVAAAAASQQQQQLLRKQRHRRLLLIASLTIASILYKKWVGEQTKNDDDQQRRRQQIIPSASRFIKKLFNFDLSLFLRQIKCLTSKKTIIVVLKRVYNIMKQKLTTTSFRIGALLQLTNDDDDSENDGSDDTAMTTTTSDLPPSSSTPFPLSSTTPIPTTISTILSYWFSHPPSHSQKSLWMISSPTHRQKIDAEITTLFSPLLLHFLHNPTDIQKYLNYWQGHVAMIVLFDQYARHIHRHSPQLLSLSSTDPIALSLSQSFISKYDNESFTSGEIPLPMVIFALMPHRHSNALKNVTIVTEGIERRQRLEGEMNALLNRWRVATMRRLAVLKDEDRRVTTTTTEDNGDEEGETEEDLLDGVEFSIEDDETKTKERRRHEVTREMVKFLDNLSENQRTIIVSLSGGVDSMVILSSLSTLLHQHPRYSTLTLLAGHINYNNRSEAAAEASYLTSYCHRQSLSCHVRHLTEIKRGVTPRDDYERMSREMRFDLYKRLLDGREGVVVLGHHKGDLRENVLSNALRGCGPLDLSGMTSRSIMDGVVIHRPLLGLEKEAIFDYAHKFGVPYFKDTTPGWSTRGQIRNELLPLLIKIYGEGSLSNLSSLAVESDDVKELVDKTLVENFMRGVVYHPVGMSIDCGVEEWRDYGVFFWRFVLREVLHKGGRGMFGEGSVLQLLERLSKKKVKGGWLQMRKDYGVFLRGEDARLFVFHPESLPWREKERFDCVGKVLIPNETIEIGPWLITATILPTTTSKTPRNTLLSQRAIPSLDDFMSGRLSYYLSYRQKRRSGDTDGGPTLVFVDRYTKATRPAAWKDTDLKLQTMLPLVAVKYETDESTSAADIDEGEEDHDTCIVRIDYVLNSVSSSLDKEDDVTAETTNEEEEEDKTSETSRSAGVVVVDIEHDEEKKKEEDDNNNEKATTTTTMMTTTATETETETTVNDKNDNDVVVERRITTTKSPFVSSDETTTTSTETETTVDDKMDKVERRIARKPPVSSNENDNDSRPNDGLNSLMRDLSRVFGNI